jgi:hypothetical protein
VLELQRHFGLIGADVEKIVTSTEKIAARGRRIEELDLGEAEARPAAVKSANGGVPV